MFRTPAMVEATDICGPMALTLYASTTDNEILWFVQLLEIDPQGNERLLTRGWLRGSQRRIDPQSLEAVGAVSHPRAARTADAQ